METINPYSKRPSMHVVLRTREEKLRPWQQCVMNKILNPGEREVVFVVGDTGGIGTGVTWFISYLKNGYPELNLFKTEPAGGCSMAYRFTQERPIPGCVIVDAGHTLKSRRSGSYEFFTMLKDKEVRGRFATSRLTNVIPVIMCMTDMPDLNKLSLDRFYIVHVLDVDKDPVIYTRDTTGFPDDIFSKKRKRGCSKTNNDQAKREIP